MCDTRASGNRRLDRHVDHVADMRRTHDSLAVGGDIAEEFVQIHILLVMRADEIMERVTGDR